MVQCANRHRSARNFAIGDFVFVKLQPYRQTTAKARHDHKLLPKLFGPFKVLDKIGNTAHQL